MKNSQKMFIKKPHHKRFETIPVKNVIFFQSHEKDNLEEIIFGQK